jgi:hypothetical protein
LIVIPEITHRDHFEKVIEKEERGKGGERARILSWLGPSNARPPNKYTWELAAAIAAP